MKHHDRPMTKGPWPVSPGGKAMKPDTPRLEWNRQARALQLSGPWVVASLARLERDLKRARPPEEGVWRLDTSEVHELDMAGAWCLHRLLARAESAGARVDRSSLPPSHRDLLDLVARQGVVSPARPQPLNPLQQLGRRTLEAVHELVGFLAFVGQVAVESLPLLFRPHRLRWPAIVHEIQAAGVTALPIIGLLAFLMGVVIAYQGGETLERYGANIFIADLVSITILREMAPLLVAIVVAGRTGSSYTAQIGTMKINEEIDALRVMGLVPNEVLTLPRLVALFISLPLLTIIADILGIMGGMVIADLLYDVSFRDFLDRMPLAFAPSTLWVGIVKAPVFAMIVTAIGCYRGFMVVGGAEGLGRATTDSVVQALFLVITVDALFSVVFNLLGI